MTESTGVTVTVTNPKSKDKKPEVNRKSVSSSGPAAKRYVLHIISVKKSLT